jgi:hypothetical protein
MARLGQYRCFFLDATGSVRTHETIESPDEEGAVDMARSMWNHRPHYHGIEVWRGACRLYFDTRLPEIPSFVMHSAMAALRR